MKKIILSLSFAIFLSLSISGAFAMDVVSSPTGLQSGNVSRFGFSFYVPNWSSTAIHIDYKGSTLVEYIGAGVGCHIVPTNNDDIDILSCSSTSFLLSSAGYYKPIDGSFFINGSLIHRLGSSIITYTMYPSESESPYGLVWMKVSSSPIQTISKPSTNFAVMPGTIPVYYEDNNVGAFAYQGSDGNAYTVGANFVSGTDLPFGVVNSLPLGPLLPNDLILAGQTAGSGSMYIPANSNISGNLIGSNYTLKSLNLFQNPVAYFSASDGSVVKWDMNCKTELYDSCRLSGSHFVCTNNAGTPSPNGEVCGGTVTAPSSGGSSGSGGMTEQQCLNQYNNTQVTNPANHFYLFGSGLTVSSGSSSMLSFNRFAPGPLGYMFVDPGTVASLETQGMDLSGTTLYSLFSGEYETGSYFIGLPSSSWYNAWSSDGHPSLTFSVFSSGSKVQNSFNDYGPWTDGNTFGKLFNYFILTGEAESSFRVEITQYNENLHTIETITLPSTYRLNQFVSLNMTSPKLSVKIAFEKPGKYYLNKFEVGTFTDPSIALYECKVKNNIPTTLAEDNSYQTNVSSLYDHNILTEASTGSILPVNSFQGCSWKTCIQQGYDLFSSLIAFGLTTEQNGNQFTVYFPIGNNLSFVPVVFTIPLVKYTPVYTGASNYFLGSNDSNTTRSVFVFDYFLFFLCFAFYISCVSAFLYLFIFYFIEFLFSIISRLANFLTGSIFGLKENFASGLLAISPIVAFYVLFLGLLLWFFGAYLSPVLSVFIDFKNVLGYILNFGLITFTHFTTEFVTFVNVFGRLLNPLVLALISYRMVARFAKF